MKLNLNIIQDNLPKNYQTKYFGPENQALSLARPFLYETGSEFKAGGFYITRAEALPSKPPLEEISVICIGGHVEREWKTGGIPFLQILNSPPVLTVFNEIQEIYNYFDQWDCQLRDELENDMDFDIRQMLRIGSTVLDNPIFVTDHALQIIFQSVFVQSQNNAFTIEVGDTPFPLPVEIGEKVKEVCRLERVITVPYLSSMGQSDTQLNYCNNLYPLGYFTGCVAVSADHRPFRDSDFPLADHFFAYFQKAFLKYLRNFDQKESPGIIALRNLLNHKPLSLDDMKQLALLPGESWYFFKLKEKRGEKYMPKDYMYATLNALMPRKVYAMIHHNEIVGLLRCNTRDNPQVLKLFQELLNRMNYTGGLSSSFTDIQKMEDYHLQASYVAELSAGKTDGQSLYFFQDHILQYMLHECTGNLPMDSLCSQGMQALIDYDKKKNADYLKTLNVYLKNEMSITRTSEELFIHRSSLLKRLDKIKRLINIDLDDPNIRLYYRICFALWENGYHSGPDL